MAISTDIVQKFKEYLGFTPTSQQVSQFSMKSSGEVEDILAGTRSDIQSNAANNAQDAISQIQSSLGAAGVDLPGYGNEYLTTLAQGKSALEEKYGLTAAEEQASKSEAFYRDIAQKGPMFEEVMRGGLEDISPSFLGATRSGMEDFYKAIPNPFVRDKMVNSYMDASDRGLTSTLNALNGLYQTVLIGAENVAEMDAKRYNNIAGKISDLYGDIQWISRNRFQEKQAEEITIAKEGRAEETRIRAEERGVEYDIAAEERIEATNIRAERRAAGDISGIDTGITIPLEGSGTAIEGGHRYEEFLTPEQTRETATLGVPKDASNAIIIAMQRGDEEVVKAQLKHAHNITDEEASSWVTQVKNIVKPPKAISQWELSAMIRQWLISPEAKEMTGEEKAVAIIEAGGDPADYGIYTTF